MNEMFKKFEILINDSSNNKKKEHCANYIVDIFKRILSSDVNIKSRIRSIKKHSKLLNITWIMWKNLMKQDILNSEKDRIRHFHKVQRITKMLKKVYSDECKRPKKDIFNLNFKEKKVIISEKSKLHR